MSSRSSHRFFLLVGVEGRDEGMRRFFWDSKWMHAKEMACKLHPSGGMPPPSNIKVATLY